jgi:hypothetical protein
MTKEELAHYITKYKEHEENAVSTIERNIYWANYQQLNRYVPRSKARWEHG